MANNKAYRMRLLPLAIASGMLGVCFVGCRIEPPLKLADTQPIEIRMPEIVTDINVIWDADPNWQEGWWYGWDEEDVRRFGSLDYPDPETYEVRLYYLGKEPSGSWLTREGLTVEGSRFRRRFYFGYHDMALWSNVVTADGTQSLIFDESNPDNIRVTTSLTRLMYSPSRSGQVHNSPDIFYGGLLRNFHVSDRWEDYDYYDEERNVYVKHINAEVTPLVYTYLVQAVIYNNKGRITGLAEKAAVSSLAKGVSIHTGNTSDEDAVVCYEMRLKSGLKGRGGRDADILGGKLTTFGLCGMEPWVSARSARYEGPRADLRNHVSLNLHFSNTTDSVYVFDVTEQMQRQAHGGIITIEIDADTIPIPVIPGGGGAGSVFDPYIEELTDTVVHEFGV